ncbi:hypothetical protein QVD17_36147 [Tagetes erecta]|uniref:Nucleic acid binding NABP domain-containing protein n=1 Tax=Tagetes erecta TaxID=13708 RepID=A0AAD8NBN9_TARER|nr:hypothetical protein QVD17_36147 [Tagetes erecta]
MSPVAMSLEELIPSNHMKSHVYSILIRTGLTLSTLVVALSIPFFALVFSLIGSLMTMLVSLCVLIVIVGVVSAVIGTYTSLLEIVRQSDSQANNFPGMELSGRVAARNSAANNHLASTSNINTAGNGHFLRRCNYPSPVIDSQHGSFLQGRNSYIVSHGHEDMQALHKLYIEALLAQHNQQYGSTHFGRSGSLNHLHEHPTYSHVMPYQGNVVEKSRPLSQPERTIQIAPALRNSVGEINFDRGYVSSVLDELKNNKAKSFEVSDVIGHVIELKLISKTRWLVSSAVQL